MVEKILNINIDDENSSKIAEILGNKTCKKILGLIADKDSISEGDISKQLKIPANTVNYNIKKLISAGFIEETKTWFWSVKGKKIKTFKLANKKIIISTKKSFKSMLITILGVGLVGFVMRLVSNLYSVSKTSSLEIMSSKANDLVYSAAPAVTASTRLVQPSIFQNTLLWFILGCFIGLFLFLIFNKMKGGKK